MAVPVGQPLPVAVQFRRRAMRLPYIFRIRWFPEYTIRVYPCICGLYFPLIESNQFARKNFFSVGKNVFEGAMIGRNVVVI
jgi:hypothetical protein